MQNFDLLKQLGKTTKPILLKRGLSSTIEEWLMSAEYIMAGGNEKVILCERGIRTFETFTRNTCLLYTSQQGDVLRFAVFSRNHQEVGALKHLPKGVLHAGKLRTGHGVTADKVHCVCLLYTSSSHSCLR